MCVYDYLMWAWVAFGPSAMQSLQIIFDQVLLGRRWKRPPEEFSFWTFFIQHFVNDMAMPSETTGAEYSHKIVELHPLLEILRADLAFDGANTHHRVIAWCLRCRRCRLHEVGPRFHLYGASWRFWPLVCPWSLKITFSSMFNFRRVQSRYFAVPRAIQRLARLSSISDFTWLHCGMSHSNSNALFASSAFR